MSYEKLAKIAELLYERTKNNNIKWEATESHDVFQASFSHSSVRIEETQNKFNRHETDIEITVINEDGEVVEQFTDEDISELLEKSYQKNGGYTKKARRDALGVDVTLDEIIEVLSSTDNNLIDDDDF